MKMRKLFAGLAAAATLLGGMALGAATANAAAPETVATETTFTFEADKAEQWTGRTLGYYKLADYVMYGDAAGTGANAPVYGVQTIAGHADAIRAALKTAGITVEGDADPMAHAMGLETGGLDKSETSPWATGTTRKFADALADALKADDLTPATLAAGANDATKTVTLPAGVYLFIDSADGSAATDKASLTAKSAPMVVASGTLDAANKAITDPATGASVNLKNHVTPVTKTHDDADGTVSTGQTVNYTATTDLPVTTGFKDYVFTLTDTPGKGQDVNKDVAVTVALEGGIAQTLTAGTDYELTYTGLTTEENATDAAKFAADGTKSFTIDFAKLLANAEYNTKYVGRTVTVTYSAIVTAKADPVTNKVEVDDNHTKAEAHTNLKLGKFSFTKVDADRKGVSGAVFEIEKKEGGAKTPADAKATSGTDGKVTFEGLADGVYTVTETTIPGEFLQSAAAKFEVTIKDGVAVYFNGTDVWGLAPDSGNDDLSGGEITGYEVKNVRSITELPETGAAGIALFTLVGLLLAGAAAAVFAKSRSTKRALQA